MIDHGSKRHDVSRQLLRVWIEKYEAGEFDNDAQGADLIQQMVVAGVQLNWLATA